MKTHINAGVLGALGLAALTGFGVAGTTPARAEKNYPACSTSALPHPMPQTCACPKGYKLTYQYSIPNTLSSEHRVSFTCTRDYSGASGWRLYWGDWGGRVLRVTALSFRPSLDGQFVGVQIALSEGRPIKVALNEAQVDQMISTLQREKARMRETRQGDRPLS